MSWKRNNDYASKQMTGLHFPSTSLSYTSYSTVYQQGTKYSMTDHKLVRKPKLMRPAT